MAHLEEQTEFYILLFKTFYSDFFSNSKQNYSHTVYKLEKITNLLGISTIDIRSICCPTDG